MLFKLTITALNIFFSRFLFKRHLTSESPSVARVVQHSLCRGGLPCIYMSHDAYVTNSDQEHNINIWCEQTIMLKREL